jgi:hypothetical protein
LSRYELLAMGIEIKGHEHDLFYHEAAEMAAIYIHWAMAMSSNGVSQTKGGPDFPGGRIVKRKRDLNDFTLDHGRACHRQQCKRPQPRL